MKLFAFILIFVTATVFISCKKYDSVKDAKCRLTSVIIRNNGFVEDTIRISYNEDGKLAKVQSFYGPKTTKLFTYSTHQITAEERFSNGQPVSKAISTLNDDGKIASIYFTNQTGDTVALDSFFYSSGQLIASKHMVQYRTKDVHVTYSFLNGNCIEEDRGYKNFYTHQTRNLVQDADPIRYAQLFQYGAVYLENQNLVKQVQDGASLTTANYTYEFDEHAMVSKANRSSSNGFENEYFYGYECE